MAAPIDAHDRLLSSTTRIVAALVASNEVAPVDLPPLIEAVYRALASLRRPERGSAPECASPAIPIHQSVRSDYIVCLEDGRRMKLLKRYLRTRYKMTPEQYRAKWRLPPDYPMVAPGYAAKRSALAKQHGLGTNRTGPARPSP